MSEVKRERLITVVLSMVSAGLFFLVILPFIQ
jgi:hypothetical protein